MKSSNKKKNDLLGMPHGTANGRLKSDILWALLRKLDHTNCFVCGLPMTRETFSIEHIQPWEKSINPAKTFFDIENIDFSHRSCNRGEKPKTTHGTTRMYGKYGCRCGLCRKAKAAERLKYIK